MFKSRHARRALVSAVLLSIVVLTLISAAGAQDFTLTASPPSPPSVLPGGQPSTSNLTLGTLNSVSGVDVSLTCSVAPQQVTGTPTCVVSPAAVTTPANPTLTISTVGTTPPALYTVTVTGTGPTTTHQATVNLTALAVTPEYTLTITTVVTPSSVHAGSGATAVVTVNPINGYTGTVTLSCSAITPAVTPSPTCTFNPASVSITNSTEQPSTLTINTSGPATTTSTSRPMVFYVLCLPLPGIAWIGLGFGARKRYRKELMSLMFLSAASAALMLLPACNTSSTSTTSPEGTTPNNTYTFTITGADENAVIPSNTSQSVSLTVD